jgi:hypothetical protein
VIRIALTACILIVAGFVDAADAAQMSRYCRGIYQKYNSAPGPKAFGVGADGSCWWASKPTVEEAKNFVVDACRQKRRPRCRVTESKE